MANDASFRPPAISCQRCGKVNAVGDRQLFNTAAELTRIMGHRNPDQFFNDPMALFR